MSALTTPHFPTGLLRKCFFAIAIVACVIKSVRAQDAIWLEGEKPTTSNIPVKAESCQTPAWLSDGNWLMVNIEADKVEKAVPKDGASQIDHYLYGVPKRDL